MIYVEGEYLGGMLGLIARAERSIDACCFEWCWYPGYRQGTVQGINRALGHAVKRGVRVRVLLHNESMRGHLGKINRHTAHELKVLGCDVRMGGTAKVLHAKFWVLDGVKGVVGSHNLSTRATKSNAEVSVLVEAEEDVNKLGAYFEGLWETWGR